MREMDRVAILQIFTKLSSKIVAAEVRLSSRRAAGKRGPRSSDHLPRRLALGEGIREAGFLSAASSGPVSSGRGQAPPPPPLDTEYIRQDLAYLAPSDP